ncbi:MAG TPA: hypothetical protein VHL53_14690 [Acidimicrobiia bacterium]|nr:hypothetical protein [Acidimicrobiia bacterium]
MAQQLAHPSVWRIALAHRDRVAAWSLVAVACLSLVAGTRLLGASPYGAEEVALLISGGFGALFALALAIFLLVTADLRDEAGKLDRLELALGGRPLVDPRRVVRITAASPSAAKAVPSRRRIDAPTVAAAGLVALGGAILIHGWHRAAATPQLERALGGLSEGLVGLALAVGVLVASAVRSRRAVLRRMHTLFDAAAVSGDGRGASGERQVRVDDGDWTAPGLRRIHRRSCAVMQPKLADARPVTVPDSGLEPCLLCHREP